jgi:hypothetical protein
MKKIFLSIFFFFFVINVISQNINYIPYYHLVNRAKFVKCVDNNYDSAIVYYLQAFGMVDYILLEDLRNFTQCAALTKHDSLVYYAMDKCIIQTVYLDAIFHYFPYSLIDHYKNTEKGKEYYAIEQKNVEKYKEKYYNSPHKKILDSLVISDQEVRNKANWFYWTFPNTKKARKLRERWHIIDSCNRLVIDKMIEKYDFPNERNGCFNDYIFLKSGVVLTHYRDTNFLHNIEYKALIEGKLSPDCYARKAGQTTCGLKLPSWDYTYCYRKEMTTEEKEQVNKNRYEIGLPSVEEENLIIQCNRIEYQQRKVLETKHKKDKKK